MTSKRKHLTGDRRGFSDLLMYQHYVGFERREETDAVIRLKDDSLLAAFWLQGSDMEAASGSQLQYMRAAWNQAGQALDAGWMLHIEDLGRLEHDYIPGLFDEPALQVIDECRAERAAYYESYTALYVTWKPSLLERTQWGQSTQEFLAGGAAERVQGTLRKQYDKFQKTLQEYAARLSRVLRVRRMRISTTNCELLQSLNFVINGTWHPCRPPRHGSYLDTYLARELLNDRNPGELRYGGKEVVVVGLRGYPAGDDDAGTEMGMLSELRQLGIEYRWSNRFILLDYQEAQNFFGKLRKVWKKYRTPLRAQLTGDMDAQVNDDAVARVEEVRRALSDLEGRVWAFGHHTCCVVLMGQDRTVLLEAAQRVISKFQEAGFAADIERLNGFEAWRGTFPGHGRENVRKPIINMVQVGDLAPLMSEWRGEQFCQHPKFPPRSPPIFLGKTKSGSSFRFHLHVDDVGHTLMLGPTGAGKSAFLSFLVAQWGRYPGSRVICFDKGYSMLGLTLACADAVHYSLGSDLGPTLAPLAALDTRAQIEWAQSWVRTLFSKLGFPLTNDQRLLLDRAVDMLAKNSNGAAKRSLTALLGQLQDVSLRDALQFYTAGSGARVLNGKSDDLRYARMTVFDLEELMTMEPAVVSPTLLFLFESIQRRLTGAPTLLVIDEAWLALDNVQFSEKLREWLKVLRKANCAVVLATQSITDIVDSPIGKAVLENCPTRVLLPNHDATNPALRALYADHLQLTDEQIGIIATGIRKRHYYYSARHVDGARGRLFELDLDDITLSLVGAGSKQELARMRELSGAHGRAWVAHWLAERGCHRWAERYVELEEARQRRVRTSAA